MPVCILQHCDCCCYANGCAPAGSCGKMSCAVRHRASARPAPACIAVLPLLPDAALLLLLLGQWLCTRRCKGKVPRAVRHRVPARPAPGCIAVLPLLPPCSLAIAVGRPMVAHPQVQRQIVACSPPPCVCQARARLHCGSPPPVSPHAALPLLLPGQWLCTRRCKGKGAACSAPPCVCQARARLHSGSPPYAPCSLAVAAARPVDVHPQVQGQGAACSAAPCADLVGAHVHWCTLLPPAALLLLVPGKCMCTGRVQRHSAA